MTTHIAPHRTPGAFCISWQRTFAALGVASLVAAKLAALPPSAVRLNKRLVNLVYERMGMLETLRYREDDALKALFDSEDAVAAERRRIQNEQGWAAFKQERDRGYQS